MDRLFAARAEPAGDVLTFRSDLAAQSAALSLVLELAAGRADLAVEAVEVPLADYPSLAVEDFMVSLYNDYTVQRLRIATADGGREDALAALAEAVAAVGAAG